MLGKSRSIPFEWTAFECRSKYQVFRACFSCSKNNSSVVVAAVVIAAFVVVAVVVVASVKKLFHCRFDVLQ